MEGDKENTRMYINKRLWLAAIYNKSTREGALYIHYLAALAAYLVPSTLISLAATLAK